MARRPRRALRGGRRLPDHLLVHGGLARLPARVPGSLPGRHDRPPRGQLPLDPPGARGGERAGAPSRGVRQAAAHRTTRRTRTPPRAPSPTPTPRSRSCSARCGASTATGVPFEEMAVIYRINARSEPYEEAFAEAGHPLSGARRCVPATPGAARRAGPAAPGAAATRACARWSRPRRTRSATTPRPIPTTREEVTRQADLARLRALAAEYEGAHAGRRHRGLRRRADAAVLHASRPGAA